MGEPFLCSKWGLAQLDYALLGRLTGSDLGHRFHHDILHKQKVHSS